LTSVVCQEFDCTPEEADRQDTARCLRIIDLRAFARAWYEMESGVEQKDLTPGPMLAKVVEIQVKRAKGEIE
jgi:ABC-type hemin transport system ATPase subunit